MRIVLDANVFISGLLSKQGPPGQILDAWLEGQFSLFVSPPIVAKIQRVLAYPRIRERLSPGQADQLTSLLFASHRVGRRSCYLGCTHPRSIGQRLPGLCS